MKVDRCVCLDIGFDRVKECARAEGLDARGVAERLGCGGGCGMCLPYIKLVIETGETEQPVLDAERFRALAAEV